MKKKIISLISMVSFVVLLALNTVMFNDKTTDHSFISLSSIFSISKANAECDENICYRNWQDCSDADGNTCPNSLVCDGGGC